MGKMSVLFGCIAVHQKPELLAKFWMGRSLAIDLFFVVGIIRCVFPTISTIFCEKSEGGMACIA